MKEATCWYLFESIQNMQYAFMFVMSVWCELSDKVSIGLVLPNTIVLF